MGDPAGIGRRVGTSPTKTVMQMRKAEDITEVKLQPRTPDPRRDNDRYPDKWQATFPRRWKLETDLRVRIQAGNRLYASGPGTVAAIDLPATDGQPKISWQASIAGEPVSVVAASGRLFVTTREGRLYTFGEKEVAEPVVHAQPAAPAGDAATQAEAIVQAAEAIGGYCLVLGLEDGLLAETLAERIEEQPPFRRKSNVRPRWRGKDLRARSIGIPPHPWEIG